MESLCRENWRLAPFFSSSENWNKIYVYAYEIEIDKS